VAFKYLHIAHCRRCGNLDLQRVSATHVDGPLAWFGRIAHLPAYRCAPCRNRFFSILQHRRLRAAEDEYTEAMENSNEPSPVGTHR
jgi:hypothetical protein